MFRGVWCALCLAALSACAGGRSSGVNPAFVANATPAVDRPPLLAEPAVGSAAADWSGSAEYANSTGLALIHAAEGYAARTAGQPAGFGVRVGVLDTGVDVTHPDLDPGAVTYSLVGDVAGDLDGHGTHVAGIIAARRDGIGVHGVAYRASLKSIKTLRDFEIIDGVVTPSSSQSDELAEAIYSAAGVERAVPVVRGGMIVQRVDDKGQPLFDKDGNPLPELLSSVPGAVVDIMNMSLSGPDPAVLLNAIGDKEPGLLVKHAMQTAAVQGKIVVVALGNDADSDPTEAPAIYADDATMKGLVVAVGALNAAGDDRAGFSNACGFVKNQCLFAPGEDIVSTYPGGYAILSGTSMSTPHVAGALAVLMAAFPNQTPAALVNRILTTADPLDAMAVSDIFGHGALNLGAAMEPFGALSVGAAGASAAVAASSVQTPASMGVSALATSLGHVLAYDEQHFQFFVDMGGKVSREADDSGFLARFVTGGGGRGYARTLGASSRIAFIVEDEAAEQRFGFAGQWAGRDERAVDSLELSFQPSPSTTVRVSHGGAGIRLAADAIGSRAAGMVVASRGASAPYLGLARDQTGVQLAYAATERTRIGFAAAHGESYFGGGDASVAALSMTGAVGHTRLGWDAGVVGEDGAALGLESRGAFAPGLAAETGFVSVHTAWDATPTTELFGSASLGASELSSGGAGLIDDFSPALGTAFLVGAARRDLFGKDELRVAVLQPFRVERLSARVTRPVGDDAEGKIFYATRRVRLGAERREIVLQTVYSRRFAPLGLSLDIGAFGRINPNHSDSPPDIGAGFRIAGAL